MRARSCGLAMARRKHWDPSMEPDLDFRNMDNEWLVGVARDGMGFRYTATKQGVLWASGWIRCDSEDYARGAAWALGQRFADGETS